MGVGSSSLPGTTHWGVGGLAQSARAPALQAGGRGFEPHILHTGPERADGSLTGCGRSRDAHGACPRACRAETTIEERETRRLIQRRLERDSACAMRTRDESERGRAGSAAMRWRGERVDKGARGMPVAHGGDEGRGRPRKAAGRREQPGIRGHPNGATRRTGGAASALTAEANPPN